MSRPGDTMSRLPLSAPRGLLVAALLLGGLSSCSVDETVNSLPGDSTTSETTGSTSTTTDTGTGGSGGSTAAPIRTVEKRNPFGNVAAADNLLWDGDFEWSSPFSDQYGWLFGPPYSYAFPAATIGAACRSGVKCVTIPKNKGIIGIGVSSRSSAITVTAHAKLTQGDCTGVDLSLMDLFSNAMDVEVPPLEKDPDAKGWCQYRLEPTAYDRKVYLLVDNNTGAEIVFDDAVILPAPMNGAPPPAPPPMAPMAEARRLRHDEARQALSDLRHPVLPPKDKDPVKRALEEHFAR